MDTKYIFVTGGVVSSLGKGIISASIGKLLQARGFKVTIQKFDPYINIDPGTPVIIRLRQVASTRLSSIVSVMATTWARRFKWCPILRMRSSAGCCGRVSTRASTS